MEKSEYVAIGASVILVGFVIYDHFKSASPGASQTTITGIDPNAAQPGLNTGTGSGSGISTLLENLLAGSGSTADPNNPVGDGSASGNPTTGGSAFNPASLNASDRALYDSLNASASAQSAIWQKSADAAGLDLHTYLTTANLGQGVPATAAVVTTPTVVNTVPAPHSTDPVLRATVLPFGIQLGSSSAASRMSGGDVYVDDIQGRNPGFNSNPALVPVQTPAPVATPAPTSNIGGGGLNGNNRGR